MKPRLTTELQAQLATFEAKSQDTGRLLEKHTSVSLRSRHRLIASSQDLCSFSPVLLNAIGPCLNQFREQQQQLHQLQICQRLGLVTLPFESDDTPIKAFSSAYKAMFFFIRGLQDALYGIMLEVSGRKVGAYSSMNDCMKNPSSPIFQRLTKELPGYAEWFEKMREQRDKIKWGVSHAPGWEYGANHQELFLNLYVVRESKESKSLDIDERVTLSDVTRAIKETNRLLDLIQVCVREITSASTGARPACVAGD